MSRQDKDAEVYLDVVDAYAPYWLNKQGYRTVPESPKGLGKAIVKGGPGNIPRPTEHPTRIQMSEDELKTPQESWIRKLGPDNAHWVLVLALEDASSHLTFGATGKAIVMGSLFDRTNGKLVWRAVGVGSSGQYGLIGMAVKSAMSPAAIDYAVRDVCRMMDKQKR